jgi:hypothetical protein
MQRYALSLIVAVLSTYSTASGQIFRPNLVAIPTPTTAEQVEWDEVRRSQDPDKLESFASRYPKSKRAAEAQKRAAKIRQDRGEKPLESPDHMKLVPVEGERSRGHVVRAERVKPEPAQESERSRTAASPQ